MHPLIARIHPSHRTALGAWLFSRLFLWTLVGRDLGVAEAMKHMLEASTTTPLVGLVLAGRHELLSLLGPTLWPLEVLPLLIAELVLLWAAAEVYGFCRKDELPHVAERATWLWPFCPLMALTVWDLSWSLGVGLGAVALGAVCRGRHGWAVVATLIAMGARPEFILLAPAIAALGWTSFNASRQPAWTRWLTLVGPLAAFSAWIVFATVMAGRAGVSLRSLQPAASWRKGVEWSSFDLLAMEFILIAALAVTLGLAISAWRRSPRAWLLMTLPLAIWPLLHDPATAVAVVLMWALPAFAHLAQVAQNPSLERPLLAGFVGGLLMMVVFGI